MRSDCQYSVYIYTVMSRRNLYACILSTTLLLWEYIYVCISVSASAIMRSVCQYYVYASTVMSRRDLSVSILPTTLLLWEDMSVCISVYASAIKRSVYQYSVYNTAVMRGYVFLYICQYLWCYKTICLSVLYTYLLYTSDGMRILGADMERPCFGPPQHSRIFAPLNVSLKKEKKMILLLILLRFCQSILTIYLSQDSKKKDFNQDCTN